LLAPCLRFLALELFDEFVWICNGYRSERVEFQQVFVAADDAGRLATHRQFEELIVIRITADLDRFIDFDENSFQNQRSQEALPIVFRQVMIEFGAAQNVTQFLQCG
jgi:hypothetical protein